MSAYDLILRGGALVTSEGVRDADIGIADGRIAAIERELDGAARTEIDARGLHVLPGGIDPHVHFNEPGRADWEGFASGSRALAAGGMTACFDMPLNCSPPVTDARTFERKLAAVRARSHVDFGLWGGLVPGSARHLPELARLGAVGIKAFMCDSGQTEFPAVDERTLREGMCRCAELGLLVAVHAESEELTQRLTARARAAGRASADDFAATRPVAAELAAIERALSIAADTGCALHIVHVSCERGVALVQQAAGAGVDVSCETCPHYLLLGEDDARALGPVAKCAPPLRAAGESARLWERLAAGAITFVASDHSPCPPELKRGEDFLAAWGGIAGCQSTMALMLSEGHHARGLALPALARLLASAAAERFGLAQKGRLVPGLDADLALVDLHAQDVVRAEQLLYRHRLSPWVGWRLRASVRRTMLRGATIFLDGRVIGEPAGRPLPRPQRPRTLALGRLSAAAARATTPPLERTP